MKVNINRQEYQTLLDMLGIAGWVLHAFREGDSERTAKYRDLEQKFFALAAEYGFEDLVSYDAREDRYYPTADYEEAGPVVEYMDEYNDEIFWRELVERLAMRDVLGRIGKKEFHSLDVKERLKKLDAVIDVYEAEFAKNGLNRVIIDF